MGIISVLDLEEVGTEPLIKELAVEADLAEKIVIAAAERAKAIAAEKHKKKGEVIIKGDTETPEDEGSSQSQESE